MNLYKLERTDRWSYDDYDSGIVAALSEEQAKELKPNNCTNETWSGWTSVENIKVIYIGVAKEFTPVGGILWSFNAG